MHKVSRVGLLVLILGSLLLLGLIFSAWVVPNVIQPAAETVWLFLRIFFLSVDQVYYWDLLTIAVVIWIIYRFAPRKSSSQAEEGVVKSEALNNLKSWQDTLISAKHARTDRDIARDKLLRLLVSHYAARQPFADQIEVRQSLEQHQLPLPASVYNFLFISKPRISGWSWGTTSEPLRAWYRRMTGTEGVEFNRMIDELIDFLKT